MIGVNITKCPRSPIRFADVEDHRDISQNDIKELSSQIEALLERGRKLRELKASISMSDPTKNLTMVTNSGSGLSTPVLDSVISETLPVVALINASDPLFTTGPRNLSPIASRTPPKSTVSRTPIHKTPISEEVATVPPVVVPTTRLSVMSVESTKPGRDETNLTVTLKTKGADVSVEVWDKRNHDLVGIGLGSLSNRNFECFDVWTNERVAIVSVGESREILENACTEIKSVSRLVTPPIPKAGTPPRVTVHDAPAVMNTPPPKSLEEFLHKRSVPPPTVESFVSFLSASPDDLDLSSEGSEKGRTARLKTRRKRSKSSGKRRVNRIPLNGLTEIPRVPPVAPPPAVVPSQTEKSFIQYLDKVNESLASYDESHMLDKLIQDMKDLETMTNRLTVTERLSPRRQPETPVVVPSPPSPPVVTSPPGVVSASSVPCDSIRVVHRRMQRRRARPRTRTKSRQRVPDACCEDHFLSVAPCTRSEVLHRALPSETRSVSSCRSISSVPCARTTQASLSLVSGVGVVNLSPIRGGLQITPSLEALRKESIEQARRNISALRGSLLNEIQSMGHVDGGDEKFK